LKVFDYYTIKGMSDFMQKTPFSEANKDSDSSKKFSACVNFLGYLQHSQNQAKWIPISQKNPVSALKNYWNQF